MAGAAAQQTDVGTWWNVKGAVCSFGEEIVIRCFSVHTNSISKLSVFDSKTEETN